MNNKLILTVQTLEKEKNEIMETFYQPFKDMYITCYTLYKLFPNRKIFPIKLKNNVKLALYSNAHQPDISSFDLVFCLRLKYKFKRIGTIQNTYSLLRTAPIEFDRQTEKNFEKYTHIDCFDFNAKYKSLYTSTIKQSNEYFSAVLSTERFKLQNDINIIKDML